jgi:hypothetical protein
MFRVATVLEKGGVMHKSEPLFVYRKNSAVIYWGHMS